MHPKTTKVNEAQVAYIFLLLILERGGGPGPLERQPVCPRADQEAASLPLEGVSTLCFDLSTETLGGAPFLFSGACFCVGSL